MSTVTITLTLDKAAAIALATVIRRVSPSEYAGALTEGGADVTAWWRALDALSPQLPDQLPLPTTAPPATYPGEPGSLADIGRQRFEREEQEYRAQRERARGAVN